MVVPLVMELEKRNLSLKNVFETESPIAAVKIPEVFCTVNAVVFIVALTVELPIDRRLVEIETLPTVTLLDTTLLEFNKVMSPVVALILVVVTAVVVIFDEFANVKTELLPIFSALVLARTFAPILNVVVAVIYPVTLTFDVMARLAELCTLPPRSPAVDKMLADKMPDMYALPDVIAPLASLLAVTISVARALIRALVLSNQTWNVSVIAIDVSVLAIYLVYYLQQK